MATRIALRLAVVAGLLAAIPASGQHITGVVLSADGGRPLEGVHLTLVRPEVGPVAEAITNERGSFALRAPEPGEWVIRGELIGYAPVDSDPITVGVNERVTVRMRMAVEAVPLDPLVVSSRAPMAAGLTGFYTRMARSWRSGLGTFLDPEDIERMGTSTPSQIFRNVVSVRVRPGRRGRGDMLRMADGCVPALFVDGVQINIFDPTTSIDDYVSADAIAAIEVYRAAWVESYMDPRGCGLVLVWTSKGAPQEEESPIPTWIRLAAATGLVTLLLVFAY